MNIVKATSLYESWLSKHLTLVPDDLRRKHQNMASRQLIFLRATFYRWMQRWSEFCDELNNAPKVLAVGDLHIENFGTWRDSEGRLIWGVNDVDEAFELPYTLDLVRLATSAAIEIDHRSLKVSRQAACDAILLGYMKGLTNGARPFVLGEKHAKLRRMALGELRNPKVYWARMQTLPTVANAPADAVKVLEQALPAGLKYRLCTRQAGEGSLGRQRFVALAEHSGGMIARETKAWAPSAVLWAGEAPTYPDFYGKIIESPYRVRDPFLKLSGRWILRRLAPDCSRIDLSTLVAMKDQLVLLKSMGRETANIHMGTAGSAGPILADLRQRPKLWLETAVERMCESVKKDFLAWQKHFRKSK